MTDAKFPHKWRYIPREGGGETLYRLYETGSLKAAMQKMDKIRDTLDEYSLNEDVMLTLSNSYFTISVDLSVTVRTPEEWKVFTKEIDKILT